MKGFQKEVLIASTGRSASNHMADWIAGVESHSHNFECGTTAFYISTTYNAEQEAVTPSEREHVQWLGPT